MKPLEVELLIHDNESESRPLLSHPASGTTNLSVDTTRAEHFLAYRANARAELKASPAFFRLRFIDYDR
jgi:hypothetical protein